MIDFSDLRKKLEHKPKKKSPRKDETLRGTSPVGDTAISISPQGVKVNKKTRSSGRITSLGQPGHGDAKNIASKAKKGKRGGV